MAADAVTLECPNCLAALDVPRGNADLTCHQCSRLIRVCRRGGLIDLTAIPAVIPHWTDRLSAESGEVEIRRGLDELLKLERELLEDQARHGSWRNMMIWTISTAIAVVIVRVIGGPGTDPKTAVIIAVACAMIATLSVGPALERAGVLRLSDTYNWMGRGHELAQTSGRISRLETLLAGMGRAAPGPKP